jgi:hypothetical protein
MISTVFGQELYNHPEIQWLTFESEHFFLHFYDDTEIAARSAAVIAEKIYPHVTGLYNFEPGKKTHIILVDTKDYANGITYPYENKILIWITPLDVALRGSHRWLQNVITHEFSHIVSIQRAMKTPINITGAYLQWIEYEKEKRPDVLYGYPNRIVSQMIPSTAIPPWLAEGLAQYMYDDGDWDLWDSHRDMILRDMIQSDQLLSFNQINTFGKKDFGNELIYNIGYAFCIYLAERFGSNSFEKLINELSKPWVFSINSAMRQVYGASGKDLYEDFKSHQSEYYSNIVASSKDEEITGLIIRSEGTANLYPHWSPKGDKIAYLSNKKGDYFSQADLYILNTEKDSDEFISTGVQSAPCWIDDDALIYSKLADNPDLKGYQYSDIYKYSISRNSEIQLTKGARAFAPIYIPEENSVAFISLRNGIQNIYSVDISSNKTSLLTDFLDGRIIHSLHYDSKDHQIIFDYTINHYRNVAAFLLQELITVDLFDDMNVDERDAIRLPDGSWIYSSDQDGIFNLVLRNDTTSTYITRTNGGAFMADTNQFGQVVYSLFSGGRYHIVVIDSINNIDKESVGYKQTHEGPKSNYVHDHISTAGSKFEQVDYSDNFSPLFFSPRVFIDYGTVKPGFYFQSAELLGRASIFGSAAANSMGDLDLALNFTYSRLFPTLYAEVYFSTRNIDELVQYSVFEIDENIRYRFLQINGGLLIPVIGKHTLNIFGNWERYRAFVKETIPGVVKTGIAYDYFRGVKAGVVWSWNELGNTYDRQINPSRGFKLNTSIVFEKNQFITGLALSRVGTLTEEFSSNDLARVSIQGEHYWEIPSTNRWTIGIQITGGWLSNKNADPFFHFFSGGYPGIRGYPYYSIGGTTLLHGTATFTLPIIREQDFSISRVSIQNSTLGIMIQYGDAWTKKLEPKLSAGIQLRFGGFSFYHIPLAIGIELHRGLSTFSSIIEDQIITYGNENRIYFTMLFGFLKP